MSKITEAQIAEWKAKYGEVYIIEVSEEPEKYEAGVPTPELDDLPTVKGYLKKPSRTTMNFALATLPRDIIKAGKAVLRDCWLGGDERLRNDENYAATAALQVIELIEIYQARLKKL